MSKIGANSRVVSLAVNYSDKGTLYLAKRLDDIN